MSRVQMEWGSIGEYPVFVYMQFLNHNLWRVTVVTGEKNNQNAPGHGPEAPAWFEYTSKKCSRFQVYREARERLKDKK